MSLEGTHKIVAKPDQDGYNRTDETIVQKSADKTNLIKEYEKYG